MILLDVEQGTADWLAARVGIPTSSCFHRIITPKTMKPASAQKGYMHELLAEWMLGASLDDGYLSDWMERGMMLEPQAVAYYELQRDMDVNRVGFVLRDDRMVGCSPDGLVGADGGLEIKCPSARVHVENLLGDMSEKHKCQVQGGLWITGRQWWDLLSFHPELPPALTRVERDEKFISALASCVDGFLNEMMAARTMLIQRGYVDAPSHDHCDVCCEESSGEVCEHEDARLCAEHRLPPDEYVPDEGDMAGCP